MKNCAVCGSANLNMFTHAGSSARHAWWCEDCGSMHTEMGVSCPEKSMLHHQVLAFHKRFGQVIGARPHVPDEKTVRFRLSLIAEEFFELLEAAGGGEDLLEPRAAVDSWLKNEFEVDLPTFIDALADLDYVIEGCRITMGVDGGPIAEEVQRANMSKLPSYVAAKDASHRDEPLPDGTGLGDFAPVKRADGKIMKPPGWTPPDIERVLIEQGWKP